MSAPVQYSAGEQPQVPASIEAENKTAFSGDSAAGESNGAKTRSEAEIAADKLYEERIEEEYAKREGGA
jgi:hypothetical protein